jgi:hypothetical protein
MGNTFPKLHQVNGIAYNNGGNATHGGTIISSDASQGDIVVLSPHERLGLIQKVHSKLGDFRVKCTYSLFAPHYYWRSMYAQVRNVIARCE